MSFNRIWISLGITVSISAAIATVMWAFGMIFWKGFLLAFVGHFIVFGIINYFTGIFMSYKMRAVEVEQLRLLSDQSVDVNCVTCGEPAVVPMLLGTDNNYTCDQCSTINTIMKIMRYQFYFSPFCCR